MGEVGREMEEDKVKLKHGNSTMPKKFPSSHNDLAPIPVRGWIFFCAGHMPSLTYLSTIRKYYSTSSNLRMWTPTCRQLTKTTRYWQAKNGTRKADVAECRADIFRHVSNIRQCRVKIANADIRQTQLSPKKVLKLLHSNGHQKCNRLLKKCKL